MSDLTIDTVVISDWAARIWDVRDCSLLEAHRRLTDLGKEMHEAIEDPERAARRFMAHVREHADPDE